MNKRKNDQLIEELEHGHMPHSRSERRDWLPIRFVSYPGHAFNAVELASPPRSINDYYFIEPQNDSAFSLQSYLSLIETEQRRSVLGIYQLDSYSSTRGYQTQYIEGFNLSQDIPDLITDEAQFLSLSRALLN